MQPKPQLTASPSFRRRICPRRTVIGCVWKRCGLRFLICGFGVTAVVQVANTANTHGQQTAFFIILDVTFDLGRTTVLGVMLCDTVVRHQL